MGMEAETEGARGLVLWIEQFGGPHMARPACFLIDTPRGFVWVEPSYYNPPGTNSAPTMHEFRGTVERTGPRTWQLRGNFNGQITVYEPDDDYELGDCMRWWLNEYLPQSGKSIAELRELAKVDALPHGDDDE